MSLTPSLLPRGPVYQGLLSGSAGAIGYALGVFAVRLARFMAAKRRSRRAPRWAWLALIAFAVAGSTVMLVWFQLWQDILRDTMGMPRLQWHDYPLIATVAVVVLFGLVEAGQLLGRLFRFLECKLSSVVPRRVSAVIVTFLLVALTVGLLNGVVVDFVMDKVNSTFSAANQEMGPEAARPATGLRSGGPGSLVSWQALGRQGRRFVSSGPTRQQLSAFNGAPALQPIRAYAGLDAARDIEAGAELATRELERAGGLQRSVVAVATTTGTGWLNEAEAAALEYLCNGDSAIVTMQYSYLPSWISFVVDRSNARQAGRALFDAVARRVRAMPAGKRPKLVVFGESLGSFGAEAPFETIDNLVARTDGALFSGPPSANPIWTQVTSHRDPGSPQWLPIYRNGETVRFAADSQDLGRPAAPWGRPRVVYLQHASDPVVWWSPDLLIRKPDWLSEPRGGAVSPRMEWIPIITFMEVTADLTVATQVPAGFGHRYVGAVAGAWAAILQPPGWTPAKTARLAPLLTAPE
ncbi:hypothetical protein DVS77_21765 [Mycolicibacterium moriokaense]|nr:hypothetical protein DVS77_21765 [Mycolicibacterium moriokaense]